MIKKTILPFLLLLNLMGCNSVEPDGNGVDTTSHNFTWQTWTFGEHSSSVLYDVAIIDENNIWAVGEIYMNDTLGQPDPHPYGLAHWDGTEWNVKRITAQNPSGGFSYIIPTGIFVISPTEIWLARGGVFLFNGELITQAFWLVNFSGYNEGIFNNGESASKLWGVTSNDLYTVGEKGALAHYNGTSWQKIESGTELNIYDIWGDYNSEIGEYETIAVAANRSVSSEKQVLKISNTTTVTPLVTEGIPYSIVDIWFEANRKYYVCGAGLFFKTNIETNEAWEELTVSSVYLESIDGEGLNDIVICGSFGELMHYNGASWRRYDQLPGGSLLLGVKIKGNMIVTVGIDNPKAFIAIGHR